jgi:hypothetical protein
MVCATLATVVLGGKTIVIAEFLAFLYVSFGDNPDGSFCDHDVTIRVARMVDVAGFVLEGFAVNIVAVIEIKNVGVPLRKSLQAFFFGNPRSNVLNDARAFLNGLCGKQALPCNARRTDPDTQAALFIRGRVARSLLRCQRRMMR